jgi:hypothetical protein
MAYFDKNQGIVLSEDDKEAMSGSSLKGTARRIMSLIVWGNPNEKVFIDDNSF